MSSAQQSLSRLLEGNTRFMNGDSIRTSKQMVERRKDLLNGQNPFATIISCSDSRVVPEFIFDVTLGDLFVIRTAGNILDPSVDLGSVEYGVSHLNTPLLIVMSHSSCGAVTATCSACKTHLMPEGALAYVIEEIEPVALQCNCEIDATIQANSLGVSKKMLQSKVISDAVSAEKIVMYTGHYDMKSGKVVFRKF